MLSEVDKVVAYIENMSVYGIYLSVEEVFETITETRKNPPNVPVEIVGENAICQET
jgi:hypothetical protein